jgi:hypothetical protein
VIARSVNAAADVIHRAQVNGAVTATGIALALESAQLLVSPEMAAELEQGRLRVDEVERKYIFDTAELKRRIAELEAERHTTNEALADITLAERSADRLTALFAPTQVLREELIAEAVSPRVQAMRALLDGQRAAVEDPHDGPLAHSYRVGRDLPETGGA